MSCSTTFLLSFSDVDMGYFAEVTYSVSKIKQCVQILIKIEIGSSSFSLEVEVLRERKRNT